MHVVVSLPFGGLERLVVDWTAARHRRWPGSTVVCCLEDAGALGETLDPSTLACLHADRGRMMGKASAVAGLRRLIRARRVEVLHSHNTAAQHFAGLACLGGLAAHVHTEHGSNPHHAGLRNRLRQRVLQGLTDRTVAVSEATGREWRARQGRARGEMLVIPNGIDPDPPEQYARLTREAARQELGLSGRGPVVGSVGRLARIKGYDRLLPAMAALVRTGVDGRLLLIGDGPERAALEAQAATLGLADRVRFAGYRADARRLLPALDLFVLPSRGEGLPVALLEAMAAGVPVAATEAGDSGRVMDDGRAGVLLPAAEATWPVVIGDILSRLDSEETRQRVESARQRVRNVYSSERTLEAYERLYLEVVKTVTASGL